MSILEFEFTDHEEGWQLKPVRFNPDLNLLVGISGAGKSHTIEALESVCKAALDDDEVDENCEWSITVKCGGTTYVWKAKTGAEPGFGLEEESGLFMPARESTFEDEVILVDGSRSVERTEQGVRFFGTGFVADLTRNQSLVGLFRRDPRIEPLALALASVRRHHEKELRGSVRKDALTAVLARHDSSTTLSLLAADRALPLTLKAYVLQEQLPEEFERLVRAPYSEIFPTVTDVRVDRASELFPNDPDSRGRRRIAIDVAIRERGVERWVGSESLSQGMYRTLVHLLELALLPPGTVLLIDEYENSMGVNCLSSVAGHLLDRARDLQFIITSHHPYVINNIDKKHWLLVRRHGSVIDVRPATEFPSLDTRSRQDAFIQLVNSDEYQDGVS